MSKISAVGKRLEEKLDAQFVELSIVAVLPSLSLFFVPNRRMIHPFAIKTRFRIWTITAQMINIQTQKAPLSFSQKLFSSFRIRDHPTLIRPMETFTKHTFNSV